MTAFTSFNRAAGTLLTLTLLSFSTLAQTTADLTDGEVRRIDKTAQKITIKHGEIKSLDMPPMTMVFQVRDPALLEQVKVGTRVRFEAIQSEGALLVTRIEAATQ
jgi:Cu(I)/Ag(I) efflux system periplasmic protein CusF